ncbi:MAG: acyltransferase family protein [Lachnospiraceae bacterium]|nr:acyltransferase family protein [Lachnospiraceae bacterium]
MVKRNEKIDLYKGILILLVVVGHFQRDLLHDIIFLFHMPLFFMISGMLQKRMNLISIVYLKNKISNLVLPYICYLLLDYVVCKHEFSLLSFVKMCWGGRAFDGVYWYITCFIATLFLFHFLLEHFSDKTVKCLIIAGGGISVIESYIAESIHLLKSPGVPWNLDVALLAVVYLAIGFYHKERINLWLAKGSKKSDIFAVLTTCILVVFCIFNYWGGRRVYYFDMKQLFYKELFMAIVIPCAFGIVLCRLVYWIDIVDTFKWLKKGLCYLGQMTLPIMYLHVPLNTWKVEVKYGRIVYMLIGVCVPIVFTVLLNRFTIMRKLFGLPDLR